MNKAVVVGTKHSIQRGERYSNEFKSYLFYLIEKHNIDAIAEEIDDNAIYIAQQMCNDLKIIHKVIEPNSSTYTQLGIEHVHEIIYDFMNEYDLEEAPNEDNCSKNVLEDYNKRVQKTYRQREIVWLKRIINLDTWPLLVICGADHFEHFCNLLAANSICVNKESTNWNGLNLWMALKIKINVWKRTWQKIKLI